MSRRCGPARLSSRSRNAVRGRVDRGHSGQHAVGDGQSLVIAQIETVGDAVLDRRDELLDELRTLREARGHLLYALMVTDIMAKGTKMLVAGEHAPLERVFNQPVVDGAIDLPGVMSRKKQVAPKLLAAL